MPIERDFISNLIERIDLVELISESLVLKRQGFEFVACCPFHQENTPSFTVSPRKQFFYCFGCKAHGNAIDFLIKFQGLAFRQAVEQLALKAGLPIPERFQSQEGREFQERQAWFQEAHRIMEKLVSIYQDQLRNHPEARSARRYLMQTRGLKSETLLTYRIGFSLGQGLEDKFSSRETTFLRGVGALGFSERGEVVERQARRVIFPIQNERKLWAGFGGRSLEEKQQRGPKYLNSPESDLFRKGSLLYGLVEAKGFRGVMEGMPPSSVLLVEGYLDVLGCHQGGYPSVVATLGTSVSERQLAMMFRSFDSVWVCYDSDAAGRRATQSLIDKALPYLKPGKSMFFIDLPEGQDPADVFLKPSAGLFQKALQQAQPLSCKLFEEGGRACGYAEGRSRFLRQLRERIEKIPDTAFKEELRNIERGYHQNLPREGVSEPSDLLQEEPSAFKPTFKAKEAILPQNRPLRLILALLLQHPELLEGLQLDDVVERWLPKSVKAFLATLREQSPNFLLKSTLAQRVEFWQDSKHYPLFKALALWSHLISPEKRMEVLSRSFQAMAERHCDLKLKRFLGSSKHRPLKPEEIDFYWKALQELQALKKID